MTKKKVAVKHAENDDLEILAKAIVAVSKAIKKLKDSALAPYESMAHLYDAID